MITSVVDVERYSRAVAVGIADHGNDKIKIKECQNALRYIQPAYGIVDEETPNRVLQYVLEVRISETQRARTPQSVLPRRRPTRDQGQARLARVQLIEQAQPLYYLVLQL